MIRKLESLRKLPGLKPYATRTRVTVQLVRAPSRVGRIIATFVVLGLRGRRQDTADDMSLNNVCSLELRSADSREARCDKLK